MCGRVLVLIVGLFGHAFSPLFIYQVLRSYRIPGPVVGVETVMQAGGHSLLSHGECVS